MIQARDFQSVLGLECLVDSPNESWDIRSPDLNRPGMQFCGFYEFFAFERPQLLGKVEVAYLEQLEPFRRREILDTYFSYPVPCMIICRNLTPPPELLESARSHDVPVYSSPMVTSKFTALAIHSMDLLIVAFWFISYLLGASKNLQFFVVVVSSVVIFGGFYFWMSMGRKKNSRNYRRFVWLGIHSHFKRTGFWQSMRTLMDRM